MIEIVDQIFTVLQYPDEMTSLGVAALGVAAEWDRPKLNDALTRVVSRRRGVKVPFANL